MPKITKQLMKTGLILICVLPVLLIMPFVLRAALDDPLIHIAGAFYYDDQLHEINEIASGKDNPQDYDPLAHAGSISIPPNVLKYETDGRYITAMQIPEMPPNVIYENIEYPNYSPTCKYYWIIGIEGYSLTGPLDYQSFINECRNRNVPPSLRLR